MKSAGPIRRIFFGGEVGPAPALAATGRKEGPASFEGALVRVLRRVMKWRRRLFMNAE